MHRKEFLAVALGTSALGVTRRLLSAGTDTPAAGGEAVQELKWLSFKITTRVTLPPGTGAGQIYLPMAHVASDYQIVRTMSWHGDGKVERVADREYGASMLHSQCDNKAAGPKILELIQTVATRTRTAAPMEPLTQAERRFWLAPILGNTQDDMVSTTAAKIIAGKEHRRDQLRAIYDWVVDHTYRDPATPGCGTGEVLKGLAGGQLGGKCADISSLLVTLARAAGFPAREVYGIRVAESQVYSCLGKSGDLSKAQHCRCEVFLDDEGWLPLDPADVRKVVLEQKVVLDSSEGQALRERMFGQWEMNWVGYNYATRVELPGGDGRRPDFGFLMYPCAFTDHGPRPCLDPARFRYEISARELTV